MIHGAEGGHSHAPVSVAEGGAAFEQPAIPSRPQLIVVSNQPANSDVLARVTGRWYRMQPRGSSSAPTCPRHREDDADDSEADAKNRMDQTPIGRTLGGLGVVCTRREFGEAHRYLGGGGGRNSPSSVSY